jgi:hypothetical protein
MTQEPQLLPGIDVTGNLITRGAGRIETRG